MDGDPANRMQTISNEEFLSMVLSCSHFSGAANDHIKSEEQSVVNSTLKNDQSCKTEQIGTHNTPELVVNMETEAGSCRGSLDVKCNVLVDSSERCMSPLDSRQCKAVSTEKRDCVFPVSDGILPLSKGYVFDNNSELGMLNITATTSPRCDPSFSSEHDVSAFHSASRETTLTGCMVCSLPQEDIIVSDVPPFKKARYSWQIKNRCKASNSCDDVPSTSMGSSHHLTPPTTFDRSITNAVDDCGEKNMHKTAELIPTESNSVKHPSVLSDVTRDVEMSQSESSGRGVPQKAARCPDLSKLTESLTQLSHIERWQCQHVAKAIVDNAINKTLEEMGLAPGSNGAVYRKQRSRIEDAGVSQAILSRGLRNYTPSDYCMHHLSPLIDRLTNMSEDMLTEHLADYGRRSQLDTEHALVGGELVTTEMMDIYFSLEGPISGRSDAHRCDDVTSGKSPAQSIISNIKMFAGSAVDRECNATQSQQASLPTDEDCMTSNEELHSTNVNHHQCPPNSTKLKPDDILEEIEKGPSSNYVLDQAVSAVICERGLQCQEFF